MGTRNLTIVQMNNEYVFCKYGQWDGYPDDAGANIINFITKYNTNDIKQVMYHYLANKIPSEDILNSKGDISKYPTLTRNNGAEILNVLKRHYSHNDFTLYEIIDDYEFAGDSLMCEWVYVIDMDNEFLEIYKGFNKDELTEKDRFFNLSNKPNKFAMDYKPVKLLTKYSFADIREKGNAKIQDKIIKLLEKLGLD